MNKSITKTKLPPVTNELQNRDFVFNEVFDEKLLQKFYGNNVDEAYLIFSMFLDTTAKEFHQLIEQIATVDFQVIKSKLHKMQPNFRLIGLSLFYEKFSLSASLLNMPSLRLYSLENIEKLKDLFYTHYLPTIKDEILRIEYYLKATGSDFIIPPRIK